MPIVYPTRAKPRLRGAVRAKWARISASSGAASAGSASARRSRGETVAYHSVSPPCDMSRALSPATTVTEAFNEVNPDVALPPDDRRHVDFTRWRGEDPIGPRVGTRIERANEAPEPRYIKQLVAGHRGSGKTTELFRLQERLEKEDFVVLYFDSADDLYLEDVDYADVLLATITQVVQQAAERDLHVPDPRLDQLRAKVEPIVVDVVTETTRSAGGETGGGARAALFAKIRAAYKKDKTKREAIRAVVQQSPTLFLDDLNYIIDNLQRQIESRGKAGLVVIVDSLDRVAPNKASGGWTTHSNIFVTHAEQLKAPRCHMVFTVPISLVFDENLGTHYDQGPVLQPMVRVREEDGSECAGAVEAMVEAVRRRVDLDLFDDAADARRLCLFSGGHIRHLMTLLAYATDYADERFTTESVARAERSLTRDFDRLVRDADLPKLVRVHREKRLPTDEDFELLPYHLIVLTYQNGDDWADVHPAVRDTRKFREAWAARDTPLASDG